MAKVIKRTWKRGRTKHVAYGYTLQVNGKQVREFDSEWTKDQAQDALAARILERETPAATAPKTFGEVAGEYLLTKRAGGKRSIVSDERHLRAFTREFGAETPITEITAQRIAAYARRRAAETSRLKRTISPGTVNRELSTLRHMVRLAEEWGYLGRAAKVRLFREPEGRLRWLTEEEIARLLATCQTSRGPHLTRIVTVALNTGMRLGEILGLAWERVDFARGVLLMKETKNGRRREIPMNTSVYQALSTLPGPKTEGPVFRRTNGTGVKSVRTAFEGVCAAIKLEDFHFHDLRHTYASWLVMRGRSLKEVQELLGHRSFSMTLRYAHLSPERLREAAGAVEFSPQSAHGTVESESMSVSS